MENGKVRNITCKEMLQAAIVVVVLSINIAGIVEMYTVT